MCLSTPSGKLLPRYRKVDARLKGYKDVEYSLYHYKARLAGLKAAHDELALLQESTDVHAQAYEMIGAPSGNTSNPVEQRILKLESIMMKIKLLQRWTAPITQMVNDLATDSLQGSYNADLLNVLKLCYFGGNPVGSVAFKLNTTKRSIHRLKYKLVMLAKVYLSV